MALTFWDWPSSRKKVGAGGKILQPVINAVLTSFINKIGALEGRFMVTDEELISFLVKTILSTTNIKRDIK